MILKNIGKRAVSLEASCSLIIIFGVFVLALVESKRSKKPHFLVFKNVFIYVRVCLCACVCMQIVTTSESRAELPFCLCMNQNILF